MSVGKKILQARLRSQLTQQQVSEMSGLAVSYLSRVENGRITPSLRTLNRISRALGVPVASFLSSEVVPVREDRCPVSLSGRCMLDSLFVGRGRRPKMEIESYSPRQLEILKTCNLLLQKGDREVLRFLGTVMNSLLALSNSKQKI
ncbi:MAG: helix-turn-helix transcriptional regulator [Acidobacteria bacterium]|nr:helix-turn-helix transcriptional regulator [Acidobacteriota bacterium]